MLYDETLPLEEMEITSSAYLRPDEELRVSLCTFNYIQREIANLTLIDDPLGKIILKGPAILDYTPGDPYVTLIPQGTGEVSLRVGHIAELNITISEEWAMLRVYTGKDDRETCIVPWYNGTDMSTEEREKLWDRYYRGAPERQRQPAEQYKIVKRV